MPNASVTTATMVNVSAGRVRVSAYLTVLNLEFQSSAPLDL